MTSQPFVSVVMPVFNAEKYLISSIESILNQTYLNFEFIIINDGSTDNSLEIIKQYKAKDDRIVIVSRENKGLSFSLNEGILLSKGKYIARMDADDISLENRLQKQVGFMENNLDIGVCGSWIKIFEDEIDGHIWKLPYSDDECKVVLFVGCCFAHPTVMIRKNILDTYGVQYKKHLAEDYGMWVCLSKITKFANMQEVLLLYRQTLSGMSNIAKKDINILYQDMSPYINTLLQNLEIKDETTTISIFSLITNTKMASMTNILKSIQLILRKNNQIKFYNQYFLAKYFIKKMFVYLKQRI